jgi:hypothetical protein
MILKSGRRFSEKIMLKQMAKAKWRSNPKPFRFIAGFNLDQFSQGLSLPGLSFPGLSAPGLCPQ